MSQLCYLLAKPASWNFSLFLLLANNIFFLPECSSLMQPSPLPLVCVCHTHMCAYTHIYLWEPSIPGILFFHKLSFLIDFFPQASLSKMYQPFKTLCFTHVAPFQLQQLANMEITSMQKSSLQPMRSICTYSILVSDPTFFISGTYPPLHRSAMY